MAPKDTADLTDGSSTDETGGTGDLGLLTGYFLKLGTIGFGGPVALADYMQWRACRSGRPARADHPSRPPQPLWSPGERRGIEGRLPLRQPPDVPPRRIGVVPGDAAGMVVCRRWPPGDRAVDGPELGHDGNPMPGGSAVTSRLPSAVGSSRRSARTGACSIP
jgi:hypothetical protein